MQLLSTWNTLLSSLFTELVCGNKSSQHKNLTILRIIFFYDLHLSDTATEEELIDAFSVSGTVTEFRFFA